MTNRVGDDGDDAGDSAQRGGLLGGETRGESAHGAFVGVENPGRAAVRRKGAEDAGVPVAVGGERKGLVRVGDVDDEGLLGVGGDGGGGEEEERESDEVERE